MKSKKHIFISSCIFAIIASLGFSSIFFLDSQISRINENTNILEKRIKDIVWNIKHSDKVYEDARILRTQIDILSALNVDVSLKQEELIDILRSSASNVIAIVKDSKGETLNVQKISDEVSKSINSYRDFEKILRKNMKIVTEYGNNTGDQIINNKQKIDKIVGWKTIALAISIVFNTMAFDQRQL